MLLLGFLLVSMAYAAPGPSTIDNYAVQIENSNLISVHKTDGSSNILNLHGQGLRSIGKLAFHDLIDLKNLSLTNNELETLLPSTFSNLPNLEHLNLANNRLQHFTSAFKFLGKLKSLDITNNPIDNLKKGDFEGLECSADIHVSPASLSDISSAVFDDPATEDPESTKKTSTNHLAEALATTVNEPIVVDFDRSGFNESLLVKVCINEGKVMSLEVMKNDEVLIGNCKKVELDYESKKVSLHNMGISGFVNGWYRLNDYPVKTLDLSDNEIVNVTSELLNNLPESLTDVTLAKNKIESLKKGIINNKNLRSLNFWKNAISEIEDGALEDTRLTELHMISNRLKNTRFVATLPSTLMTLSLNQNEIVEVSAQSFAGLNKLIFVGLDENKITKLESNSLRGLSSLKILSLQQNGLKNIEVGSFQDLKKLEVLSLDYNDLTTIERGTFDGLETIDRISITSNKLTKLRKGDLHGLSSSLRDLHLTDNKIGSLETETFSIAPTRTLSLSNNEIKNIEKGSFNLPLLEELQLTNNLLEVLESDRFENLGNLRILSLNKNHIAEIKQGAAKGLVSLNRMDISLNPMKILANGALYGMSKSSTTHIILHGTPVEVIQGCLFKHVPQ